MCSKYTINIAIMLNIIVTAGFVYLVLVQGVRDIETMFFVMLYLAAPLSALAALFSTPDLEERRLVRRVRIARLKKELAELEGKK